ncbi:MAG: hypothetical protein GQF41_0822 [Candidatus Rifleibacterium amylolyticum]|nr:MAG: hypothetical protein GQF41_0822 [Candidatus Rifleibacterium amylolyticum]
MCFVWWRPAKFLPMVCYNSRRSADQIEKIHKLHNSAFVVITPALFYKAAPMKSFKRQLNRRLRL